MEGVESMKEAVQDYEYTGGRMKTLPIILGDMLCSRKCFGIGSTQITKWKAHLGGHYMRRFYAVAVFIFLASVAGAEEPTTCRALDTREFGLVSDGEISDPWSEVELVVKYGPPCQILELGEVFIERSRGRILELGPKTSQLERLKTGTFAIKKQYIYKGDYSSGTSVFTIVDGVVVKKERIY